MQLKREYLEILPLRVSNFWSNNYIEYESKGDRNKTLSVKEYLNKIRPYLKDIINNLKKSDTWKIPLTIVNNFISSVVYKLRVLRHFAPMEYFWT